MSIEYGLVFTFISAHFDILYWILFVQVTLSHFSKFEIIVGMPLVTLFSLIKFFVPKKNKTTDF